MTPLVFIALSLWIVYVQVASHLVASGVVVGVIAVVALVYMARGRKAAAR